MYIYGWNGYREGVITDIKVYSLPELSARAWTEINRGEVLMVEESDLIKFTS